MKIVIVGGGTAGWLSAMYLANLNVRADGFKPYQITVIESPNIPIIGAGEGSTGALIGTLKEKLRKLEGLNSEEFLKKADATVKLGLNCKNWNGDGKNFLEPLQPSSTSWSALDIDYLLASAHGKSYQASATGTLWDENKVPFYKDTLKDAGGIGYHFDAHKVGAYFKEVALKNGVELIEADVTETDVCPGTGNLLSVTLDNGNGILADMWFDCTGFNKLLINAVGGKWKSYSEWLPCDRAMPYLHSYEEGETIRPETLAWAMPNGWMWQIPTQQRYGCGYVYSSKFVSDGQALKEMEEITGRKIDPIRIIKFEAGRQEEVWKNNVICFGLASNFLEPLEATSIHSTIVQLEVFISMHLGIDLNETIFDVNVKNYNKFFGKMVDDFKDLIQIHYITKREDTEFWKWVKNEMPKTDKVKEIIEICKYKCPSPRDWDIFSGASGWGVWACILTGLGILDKRAIANTMWNNNLNVDSDIMFEKMICHFYNENKKFMTHNELLDFIKKEKQK
jgi:tryptophan halogenase